MPSAAKLGCLFEEEKIYFGEIPKPVILFLIKTCKK
jgi:hypothetical protein